MHTPADLKCTLSSSYPKALAQALRLKCHLIGVEVPTHGFMSFWTPPWLPADSNMVCCFKVLEYLHVDVSITSVGIESLRLRLTADVDLSADGDCVGGNIASHGREAPDSTSFIYPGNRLLCYPKICQVGCGQ